jgi:hypothetical protein
MEWLVQGTASLRPQPQLPLQFFTHDELQAKERQTLSDKR